MKHYCRFCGHELCDTFVDLRTSPLANNNIPFEHEGEGELFLPLHAYVCRNCFLVQLPEIQTPQTIFSDYTYFSSFSDSWLLHAKEYVQHMIENHGISSDSFVVELASNDGYLLQYFNEAGIPNLGIEPAANVAQVAMQKHVNTQVAFFDENYARQLLEQGVKADLIVANNVLAHVPALNSFVEGMHLLLRDNGIITVEFPYLLNLIDLNQFDTIYHEHYSYFSVSTAASVFRAHGLRIFHIDNLMTHGGSLRLYICHDQNDAHGTDDTVTGMIADEKRRGVNTVDFYTEFDHRVRQKKREVLSFLISLKNDGKTIAGYGAPAKGNTLLNYCGIGTDIIDYTVDRNPIKQGTFLPGSRIPVYEPERIQQTKPDYVLILPWNLCDEIMKQNDYIRQWGGQFITLIPDIKVR